MQIYEFLGLVRVVESRRDGQSMYQCTNCTVINLVLTWIGAVNEERLTVILLVVQIVCSAIAFVIRYPLASLFY